MRLRPGHFAVLGASFVLIAAAWVLRDRFGPGNELRASARGLDNWREEAKRAGLPLEPSEIDSGERAEGLANFEAFRRFEDIVVADRALRQALDVNSSKRDSGAMLLARPEAVEALLAASRIENVDLPVPWSGGVNGVETDYGMFSRYVAACCYLANKRMEAGDALGALDWLEAGARICVQIVDEPSFRSVPAWSSCTNRVLRTLYGYVKGSPRGVVAQGANRVLSLIVAPKDLSLYVRSECLRCVVTARKYDSMMTFERSSIQVIHPTQRVAPPEGDGAGAALEANSLKHWVEMAELARPEDGDLGRAGIAVDDAILRWSREQDPSNYLVRAVARTYQQTAVAIQRVEQMKRLVATALEVIGYWAERGAFPEAINASEAGHFDPIGQRMLVYVPTRAGFSLMAAGERGDGRLDPPLGDLRLVPQQGYALTFGEGE